MQYEVDTDWTRKWATYTPHKTAVSEWETGRSLTYLELNELGDRLSYYLQATFELRKGDRIAVLAEFCLEYIVLFVAAQKQGFTLVPLNYRLTASELDYQLKDAVPSLLFYPAGWEARLETCAVMQSGKGLPIDGLIEELRQQPDPELPEVKIGADHPIFILYTSGTTGYPKGALYTHRMLFWNSINTAMSLVVNPDSRTVSCMPPFHTGGWNVLLTPFLHHGGYVCLLKKFDPAEVLASFRNERPTIFMGVPTMLQRMASIPDFDTADLSSLLYFIVGGEAMAIPLIEKWQNRGVYIRQGYGMTEVGPNLTSLHHDDAIRKQGSIGRPNFYVQTKVVDEHGQDCGPNQPGELLLRGPMVTPGYWHNDEATQKAIHDGWFHTGDIVRVDTEGYLYVVDRIKNMFISGGENVYPAEVERVLVAHPQVSEAVVIGVPDPQWGETGKAFIVSSHPTLSAEILTTYCRDRLAKFKVPKQFVFLTELPKSDTGKINRKVLVTL